MLNLIKKKVYNGEYAAACRFKYCQVLVLFHDEELKYGTGTRYNIFKKFKVQVR
jgi:hypothetical protein